MLCCKVQNIDSCSEYQKVLNEVKEKYYLDKESLCGEVEQKDCNKIRYKMALACEKAELEKEKYVGAVYPAIIGIGVAFLAILYAIPSLGNDCMDIKVMVFLGGSIIIAGLMIYRRICAKNIYRKSLMISVLQDTIAREEKGGGVQRNRESE